MAAICVHCHSFRCRRYDHSDALTRFHSRSPPAISVLDYLKRVVRYIPRIEVGLLSPPPASLARSTRCSNETHTRGSALGSTPPPLLH